jgi:hypothetical protein
MAYRWRLWALGADAAGPCSGIRFLSVTEPERGGFEIGP